MRFNMWWNNPFKRAAAQSQTSSDIAAVVSSSAGIGGLTTTTSGSLTFPSTTQQGLTIGGGYSGGSITIGPGTTYPGFPTITALTKEEQEELNNLKVEHSQEIKRARLVGFMKLPTEVRQLVINMYTWEEYVCNSNSINVGKSERLKELEMREEQLRWLSHGGVYLQHQATSYQFAYHRFPLPEGLTLEDLKAAHIEASLEEEVLNEQ